MTAAVSRRVDDEGLPLPPPVHGKAARWLLRMLAYGEGVMFLAIAVALLTIAVVVFVRGLHDLVLPPAREPFQVTVTRAVNSVLFIVVVLELLRTIVSRLEGGGFQLQPFGHRHHLGHPGHPHRRRGAVPGRPRRVPLGRSMTELAVNAGVVLALSVALVLVRRFARLDRA